MYYVGSVIRVCDSDERFFCEIEVARVIHDLITPSCFFQFVARACILSLKMNFRPLVLYSGLVQSSYRGL